MSVSRMLGSDPGTRLDAIRWGHGLPILGASLFLASAVGSLIAAGVAFLIRRSAPAATLGSNSGVSPARSTIGAYRKFPNGRIVEIQSSSPMAIHSVVR
jgi:hypothetical protein